MRARVAGGMPATTSAHDPFRGLPADSEPGAHEQLAVLLGQTPGPRRRGPVGGLVPERELHPRRQRAAAGWPEPRSDSPARGAARAPDGARPARRRRSRRARGRRRRPRPRCARLSELGHGIRGVADRAPLEGGVLAEAGKVGHQQPAIRERLELRSPHPARHVAAVQEENRRRVRRGRGRGRSRASAPGPRSRSRSAGRAGRRAARSSTPRSTPSWCALRPAQARSSSSRPRSLRSTRWARASSGSTATRTSPSAESAATRWVIDARETSRLAARRCWLEGPRMPSMSRTRNGA